MGTPLDSLPDFQNYHYAVIQAPATPKLIAWSKAHECERRLGWYSWVQNNNDQATPQHVVLLNDALSAFLLSFEAALQHAKDQASTFSLGSPFDVWLASQPENNVLVRGLRTLRHLDAHIAPYPIAGNMTVVIGGSPKFIRRWSLQPLKVTDLDKLFHAQLKVADLAQWNALIESAHAIPLLTEALDRLNALLAKLEAAAP